MCVHLCTTVELQRPFTHPVNQHYWLGIPSVPVTALDPKDKAQTRPALMELPVQREK